MTTVYPFGGSATHDDPRQGDKTVTGGKGANLAEMASIGLPVPPGFTITTEECVRYLQEGGDFGEALRGDVAKALEHIEAAVGKRFGDAAAQGRLADAWRADKTQNRAVHLLFCQLTHSNMLKDAILDFIQSKMPIVEHFFSVGEAEVIPCFLIPGDVRQPLDVIAYHTGFWRYRWHCRKPLKLYQCLLVDLFWHIRYDNTLM